MYTYEQLQLRQSMGRFYSLSATSPPFITNYMLSRTELGERLYSLILLQNKLTFWVAIFVYLYFQFVFYMTVKDVTVSMKILWRKGWVFCSKIQHPANLK